VEVRDLNGTGTNFDRATVKINVQSVNQNKTRFIMPSFANATIRIPENSKDEDHLVLVLKAEDTDHVNDNAPVISGFFLTVGVVVLER
jgi:hypothetical protein